MSYHGTPAATASNIYLTATTTTCATVVVGASSITTTTASTKINLASFDENSPRPPVLGEEHEPSESSLPPTPGLTWSTGGGGSRYSPSFTPRRTSSCHQDTMLCRQSDAPLGFEPEGSERATPGSFVELGTPPYLRWAISLASLLEDPDGVTLFRQYLEIEGSTDMLDFWFACEGLKNEPRDDANVAQLVRLIHKRYFKASSPLKVNEALRKEVHRRVREVSKGEVAPDRRLFDEAQKQVEVFINETAYPEFLRSETYVQHVRAMQSGLVAGGCIAAVSGGGSEEESSSSSSSTGKEVSAPMGLLPTLHEDAELEVLPQHHHHSHHKHHSVTHLHHSTHLENPEQGALPLTRDMLMATQKKRALDLRPKPEAYARLCSQQVSSSFSTSSSLPNPYHMPPSHRGASAGGITYSSYNPVSRQDSELQSLSSDAHSASDSASVTNSSLDGSMYRSSRRHHHLHSKQMREQIRESASHNRDPHMHHTIIPRTQRIPRENVQPLKPDEFAAILIQKLESVQRELEVQEKFERKLFEGESGGEEMISAGEVGTPRKLADSMSRLQVTDKVASSPPVHFSDDSNQAILDMHVSRVWSDLTPSRSPGLVSPRPRSPEGRRRGNVPQFLPVMGGLPSLQPSPSPMSTSQAFPGGMTCPVTPHPYQSRLSHGARHGRKDKDGVSTLSSDSGNVHDYAEGSEHKHPYLPKSKSMPDYAEVQKQDPYGGTGHDSRMFAKESLRKTGGSRKTLTDLTDSGVSVVSDTPPCPVKDASRVISWLIQSETQVSSSVGYSHSDSSSKHRARSTTSSGNSNLQRQARGSKKSAASSNGSRSGSVERGASGATAAGVPSGSWSHGPGQPFVADPSMPPLPSPHTATQLEEACRRLEDVRGIKGSSSRQRFPSASSKTLLNCGPPLSLPLSPSTEPCGSGQSTLRRHAPSSSSSTLGRHPQPQEVTTVMFSFCDEEVPYRTKINGKHVTLRQFKEILPKKGNYRYFFKTECEDVDTRVIHEEVMEDSEILPLWEGKVMAQVKPVE